MNTQRHFVSIDGALYRAGGAVVREGYALHYREIETGAQLRASLRAGPYAWPGGYALAFLTSDGSMLCFDCARENLRELIAAIRSRYRNGWRVVGLESMECRDDDCDDMCCAHCGLHVDRAQRNTNGGEE